LRKNIILSNQTFACVCSDILTLFLETSGQRICNARTPCRANKLMGNPRPHVFRDDKNGKDS